MLYAFLITLIRGTYPTHLILLDFITVIIFALLNGYHLDVVGGPSTPHDPESDAGGRLSSWQGTQAGKVKEEGRS
jgi:hypothetical protein